MPANLIEIDRLSHRYPDGTLGIEEISLSIPAGQFLLIAGPNGAGKSTFFRHLNGLLRPTSGKIVLDGQPVSRDPKRARKLVGMVFQDADSQIIGETVFDDAAFGPENLGLEHVEIHERAMSALQAVGMEAMAGKRPHLLSGGEKRRLAIAGVLAMAPKVIVLDEPFSNLDYRGARQVLQQIIALHREGRTILLCTHDLEKVVSYADRMVILEQGRVARDASPSSLLPEVEFFGLRQPCAARLGLEVVPWLS